MKQTYDRPGIDLSGAIKSGYICSPPDCRPRRLTRLCEELGDAYHLASMTNLHVKDCVIQRVLGNGYDLEIYGTRNGRYTIVLWADYGRRSVDEIRNVPFGNVGDRVMELIERNK